MSNHLFDLSQYQSRASMSESTDWEDATGFDPARDMSTQLHPDLEKTTAEQKTCNASHASVEVIEVSKEEEADRQRLELKVERAFYEAGSGLRELRSRRLYRSTHKSFEDYCQDRFGFNRTSAQHKIRAAEVFENLFTFSKQIETDKSGENLFTFSKQVLPTKETQVRPLAKLEPNEQWQVWQQAVLAAGGMVPTERIVKALVLHHQSIVKGDKQENAPPIEFALGDVCFIKAPKHSPLRQFNSMWGVIEHVGSFSYTVRISIARDTQQCKESELTRIDEEYTADIKVVAERIADER